MDAKITLSFDKEVIEAAKKYSAKNNISLSRLMEYLLRKVTSNNFKSFEEYPIADWVNDVAEGEAEYLIKPRGRKSLKQEYFKSKQ